MPRDVRDTSEATRLRALLGLAMVVQDAPDIAALELNLSSNPDDPELIYQLAACYTLDDQLEQAMQQFMRLLQLDRHFRDDAGHKGLLAVFELLGNEDDLVKRFRRRLFTLLH